MHPIFGTTFAASIDEILSIRNGLLGWPNLGALGPSYFLPKSYEEELYEYLVADKKVSRQCRRALAVQRAQVVNFYSLLDEAQQSFEPRRAAGFRGEVSVFLKQLKHHIGIWKTRTFNSLGFNETARDLYLRFVAKAAPSMFFMGFPDATNHSQQVSRLCAAIAGASGGNPSDILLASLFGEIHDPKLSVPQRDIMRINLATHPVVAAALAYTILGNKTIFDKLVAYSGTLEEVYDLIAGAVDGLGINDDSRFVDMNVIHPIICQAVSERFGVDATDQLKSIMEQRLESASKGVEPPELPEDLHGCLAEIKFESGLRGLKMSDWQSALRNVGITADPEQFFYKLTGGLRTYLTTAQLWALKQAVIRLPSSAIIKAEVNATTLLHHHQEVRESGRLAALALYIADPMMLSPHKVFAVYPTAIIERARSFIPSFDDNIRLLPMGAHMIGLLWQNAVYLSMLDGMDDLNNTCLLADFKASHGERSLTERIDELWQLVLSPENWGRYAEVSGTPATNVDVARVLAALEASYTRVIDQYREEVYAGKDLSKFFPRSYRAHAA
jgi:hypothetical protein